VLPVTYPINELLIVVGFGNAKILRNYEWIKDSPEFVLELVRDLTAGVLKLRDKLI
jgi:hypothetical protein